jgi:archaellum component FlaF (FlaF/FlaG flagellin family)
MRLSTKLMLIFISSVIIPLVIVGYVAYDNGRDSIKQAKFDELVSINMLKADVLNNWVYNKQNSMYEMVNIPGVG